MYGSWDHVGQQEASRSRAQCGYVQRNMQRRQNPYVNMDQLLGLSQLRQIKNLYNLTDEQLGTSPRLPLFTREGLKVVVTVPLH